MPELYARPVLGLLVKFKAGASSEPSGNVTLPTKSVAVMVVVGSILLPLIVFDAISLPVTSEEDKTPVVLACTTPAFSLVRLSIATELEEMPICSEPFTTNDKTEPSAVYARPVVWPSTKFKEGLLTEPSGYVTLPTKSVAVMVVVGSISLPVTR